MTAAEASAEEPSASGPGTCIAKGALSALLEELARAPGGDRDDDWEALAPGLVVGRFELVQRLGRGGFGVVFEARDRELGRSVAFKAFRPGSRLRQVASEAWLKDEAEAVARLNHPNIVTLHDLGRCEAGPYLIMELLRGETLQERLQRGALPAPEAVVVAEGVAAGLAHAHALGVVHRDLKPANVFLTEQGGVKILDFGIAHVLGRDLKAAGTPAFMSPEQRCGDRQDARADVYAAGALLLVMVGGEPPLAVGDPPQVPPGTPRPLADVIGRALAEAPVDRPRDGGALHAELRALREALPGGGRARLRRRRVALAAAVAAAVAAGAAAGHLWRRTTAPKAPVAVAVADVENQTGERDLDALSGMLTTSLEQSRVLDVLTRPRLLEISRQHGGEPDRLDGQVARAAGKAAGVQVLLVGTLRRDGRRYGLAVQGVDPASDRELFAVSEEVDRRGEIPALVDRLSARIRRELRERMDDVRASEVQIARAVTGSVEAYQYYAQGEQCSQRLQRVGAGRPEECADSYRKALAIDPTFALAHYALALGVSAEGPQSAAQRASMAEALKYMDRVPEKERLLIRAWGAHLGGRDADALALYRVAMDRFPRETPAAYLAGELLHHDWKRAQAAPFFERVVALDPTHAWALDHLVGDLAHAGEKEKLRRLAEGLARQPAVPGVLHALSEARGWLGDVPGAVEAARRAVAAGGGSVAREDLVEALLFAGDLEAAEAELRVQLAEAPVDPMLKVDLAVVLATQGRRREGFAQLHGLSVPEGDERVWRVSYRVGDGAAAAAQEAASIPDGAEWRHGMAVLLALAGDVPGSSRFARDAPSGSIEAVEYRSLVLWRAGRPEDALAILREAERLERQPGTVAPSYLAAEVAAAAGHPEEAVESIRRFHALYEPLTIWRSWAYPRSLVLLARELQRLGQPAEARATLARFFTLWRRADPSEPLLAEARALRGRLER